MIFLIDLGYLDIRIWDILDVLIVSYLIYRIIKLLRGSIAFQIFIGLLLLYVVWWIVKALEMPLLSTLLSQFVSVGVILLIIIFQPEIRRFLLDLGESTFGRRSTLLKKILPAIQHSYPEKSNLYDILLDSILTLSSNKTGALIVLNNDPDQAMSARGGIVLNAQLQPGLLESLFNKESPLHDGAAIIQNNRLFKASTILPVSENRQLPKGIGLRHRAGVGVTEHAGVACIIISETDGTISTAFEGTLKQDVAEEALREFLKEHL